MNKITYEEKLKIIKENEDGYGKDYLSKKYNIPRSTIQNWIHSYKILGEEGLKKSKTYTSYSGEFKLSVLEYRKINGLSLLETAKHFKIKQSSTIANWQRQYKEKGFEGLCGQKGRPKKLGDSNMSKDKINKLTTSEKEELIKLRQENLYLRARLEYEKKLEALVQKRLQKTKKRLR